MSGSATSAVLYAATVSLAADPPETPSDAKNKAHHAKTGTGFVNPWDSWHDITPSMVFKGFLLPRLTGKAHSPDTTPPTVPVQKPDFLPTRDTKTLRATWLGHAAYLVEFPSGLRVLFDPVFSDRCSPFSWLGPKRYTECPAQVDEIPIIDAVVISHNHYDHMDYPTIMKIREKHPNAHFFVPLGNKKWFLDSNIKESQVTELDWWEQRDFKLEPSYKDSEVATEGNTSERKSPETIMAKIGPLPCQHTSARGIFDRSKTLWCSWSVESGGKKVFFGGDTGYRRVPQLPEGEDDYAEDKDYPHCPAFKQIGDLRGPFDLGLIPIGAYKPRWLFSSMHANPFDSVNIFKDTQCKRAMGIHWGTWVLTEEDVLEPPKQLKQALKRWGFAEEGVFDVCDIGESRDFE